LNQIIRFNPSFYPSFPHGSTIDGVVGPNFNLIIYLHNTELGNLDVYGSVTDKAEAIAPNHTPCMDDHLIPDDANVEMAAKKAAGYFTEEPLPSDEELKIAKGRDLHD